MIDLAHDQRTAVFGSFSLDVISKVDYFHTGYCVYDFTFNAKTILRGNTLTAVILGIFDEEKIRFYLPLAENERITNLIALGYPLTPPEKAPLRKKVQDLLSILD